MLLPSEIAGAPSADVATFLAELSPFGCLPPPARAWLAQRLTALEFAPGAAVVREGEAGDALYLVWRGWVEVVGRRADGSEGRIASLGPGEVFGEQALLSGEARSATVRAIEPTTVLRLERDDLAAVVRDHPDRASYFVRLALQRQRPRPIARAERHRRTGRGSEDVYILKDPRDHRYVRLSEPGAFLWGLIDGEHTVCDLTLAYYARYHAFGLDAVLDAVLRLQAAGFVRVQPLSLRHLGITPRVSLPRRVAVSLLPYVSRHVSLPDVDGVVTWLYRRLGWPIYRPAAQALLLLIALVGAGRFVGAVASGAALVPNGTALASLGLAALFAFAIQGLLHEVAHAVTCKHFGREVHRAGVGWYFFLPVAFVDTSDAWLAGKWARAAVAIAGPYTNFILSGLATLGAFLAGDPRLRSDLLRLATVGYLIGVANLNPLLEFDGYYVLMDLLDLPNLRARALGYLGAAIARGRPTFADAWLARVFFAYGALSLAYTLVVAASVLFAYQGYVARLVGPLAPPPLTTLLGWVCAALPAALILLRTGSDLRRGSA